MNLRSVLFELSFKPKLTYLNQILVISEKLTDDYPDWTTDKISVSLKNPEKKSNILLDSKRIGFIIDEPVGIDFLSKIKKGVQVYKETVGLDIATRIGIRFKYLKEVAFNFEELVEIMTEKIYNEQGKFLIIDDKNDTFIDTSYVVVLQTKNFKVRFSAGPLKKEEVFSRISPVVRDDYDDDAEPETSLSMDIDCYQENININNIYDIAQNGYNIASGLAQKFETFILGV